MHVVDRTWIRVPGPVFAQQEIRTSVVDCMCKYDDTESHVRVFPCVIVKFLVNYETVTASFVRENAVQRV